MTVGAFRPVVLVPAGPGPVEWSAAWQQAALAHEGAHVIRRDPAIQLLVDVVRALYWFHPLVWVAARRLRIERERAADDAVLDTGVHASDYADLLVALATRAEKAPLGPAAAISMVGRGPLGVRLVALLDVHTTRGEIPRGARRLSMALTLGVLLPVLAMAGAASATAGADATAPLTSGPSNPRLRRHWLGTARLSGRVVDSGTQRPVVGASVDLLSHLGEPIGQAKSDAAGGFVFNRLTGTRNEYRLYARLGSRANRTTTRLSPGGAATIEIPLSERGHALAGRVRDTEGRPIAGARVFFARGDTSRVHPGLSATQTTDAEGRYRIDGVLPNDLVLHVNHDDHASSKLRVSIEGGDVFDVDFALVRMRKIVGVVVTPDGSPASGAVVQGQHVMAWPGSDGPGWKLGGGSSIGSAGPDGRFRYKGASERMRLLAIDAARGLVSTAPVEVIPDAPGEVRLVLGPGAFVEGRVGRGDGTPSRGAIVMARSREGLVQIPAMAAPLTTDAVGRFRIGPFPPGEFAVMAWDPSLPPGRRGAHRFATVKAGETLSGVDLVIP